MTLLAHREEITHVMSMLAPGAGYKVAERHADDFELRLCLRTRFDSTLLAAIPAPSAHNERWHEAYSERCAFNTNTGTPPSIVNACRTNRGFLATLIVG